MSAAEPSRQPWNRGLTADAINRAEESNKYAGYITPLWHIRVKGNATTAGTGFCYFYDGTSLAMVDSTTPTGVQFGFHYASSTGVFTLTDGTSSHALGLANVTGLCLKYTPNNSQALGCSVVSASASAATITMLTGAAGATADDPTGTAWTLDIQAFNSI